ncbi:MAG TPA: hypothetical protein VGW38_28480, partial [Chloroflexota bacterium]|nr:hypothetical protein [Chloroflexota bacterium]
MTSPIEIPADFAPAGSMPLHRKLWRTARSFGRFVLHFAEMWIAMMVGMMIFDHLINVLAFEGARDTTSTVYQAGMMLSMTVPMVAWMRVRGHGWRHGIEMSGGMVAPVLVIGALLRTGAGEILPWLHAADGPAMMLGMLASM